MVLCVITALERVSFKLLVDRAEPFHYVLVLLTGEMKFAGSSCKYNTRPPITNKLSSASMMPSSGAI